MQLDPKIIGRRDPNEPPSSILVPRRTARDGAFSGWGPKLA